MRLSSFLPALLLLPLLAACTEEPLDVGDDGGGGGAAGGAGGSSAGGAGGSAAGGAGGGSAGGAGGSAAGGAGGSAAGGSGGSGGAIAPGCQATLHWLQKDAYKETAGRTSPLWPPHTTTTLQVVCDGVEVGSAHRENHGTLPGELDAAGDVFLVDMGAMTVDGTRAELDALLTAYEGCECATSFLSMDALGDTAVQQLVGELSGYLAQNLVCSGAVDTPGLIGLLQAGEVAAVIAELPNCTWAEGKDWATGLDAALTTMIAASGEALDAYHVCNNDASLQTALLDRFVADGTIAACDGTQPICHGPIWFLNPTP